MQLFEGFKTYLEQSELVRSNSQIDCYISGGRIDTTFKQDDKGLLVAEFDYNAIYFITGFTGDARYIISLVSFWSNSVGDDHNLMPDKSPEIEVDPVGSGADIVLRMSFMERVHLIEDQSGLLDHAGKKYSFGANEINVATQARVEGRIRDFA